MKLKLLIGLGIVALAAVGGAVAVSVSQNTTLPRAGAGERLFPNLAARADDNNVRDSGSELRAVHGAARRFRYDGRPQGRDRLIAARDAARPVRRFDRLLEHEPVTQVAGIDHSDSTR